MGQNNDAVIVPGVGRFWRSAVDAPTPGQVLQVTGAPTTATLPLTVNAVTTSSTLAATNTPAQNCLLLGQALASNSAVGAGKAYVFPGPDAWTFYIVIDPSVVSQTITVTGATFTGGTTPEAAIDATGHGPWSAFTEVGHTSPDNPLQIKRSGGDVTPLGSWQSKNIDSTTSDVSFSLAYALLQHDGPNMLLYHGANAVQAADGTWGVPLSGPVATEMGLFVIVQNGQKALLRSWNRVSTLAADAESWDRAKLAEMPVASTVLASNAAGASLYRYSATGIAA